jgi:flagellar hook-associated protein 3 FlgL
MRMSTNTIFEAGATRISELQTALTKTQQQISANRRLLTPSDDPIAAARALEITQGQNLNTQYATNRGYATNSLTLEESVLGSITTLIQDAQTQVVEAGNAGYSDTQRKYIADDLRGRLEELIGLGNTRDSEGNYMFAGFQTSTQPYSSSATGADYAGDQGQRNLQVGTGRQIPISDSGDAVFNRISSSASFNIEAFPAVGGTFSNNSISSASVTDATQLTGQVYTMAFAVDGSTTPPTTTYEVTSGGSPLTPAVTGTYVSGKAIEFAGIKFSVSGTRTGGDTLMVNTTAATNSESIFSTLNNIINLLDTPATGATGRANLNLGIATANDSLGSALDKILTVRASVGSRLKELESLDSAGDDRNIQYADTLSKLQDLDYVKAISDLSLQKTTLEAAQQSYVKIMNLSLFNFM